MEYDIQLHCKESIVSVVKNVAGVFLPLILTVVIVLAINEFEQVVKIFDQGQILLCAVSFLMASSYLFQDEANQKNITKHGYGFDRYLTNISMVIAMAISSGLYVVIYLHQIKGSAIGFNQFFVHGLSFLILLFSLYCLFRGFYYEHYKLFSDIDVELESKKTVDSLMNELKD